MEIIGKYITHSNNHFSIDLTVNCKIVIFYLYYLIQS